MATSLIEELATPRGRRRSRDSARGKLSAVQLEESASKLSFLVFRPGSVNSPHRLARQAEKRGDITGEFKMSRNKDNDGGWRTFLWNSEKGEFLGRTGCSWCEYCFYLKSAGSWVIRLLGDPRLGALGGGRTAECWGAFLGWLPAQTAPVRAFSVMSWLRFSMEAVLH